MLHQLFGTDSQKTSVSLRILLTHLLISPILRLHSPLLTFHSRVTTEDRTLQAILSRFYSCATTRPPSPPIAIVASRCLLSSTFQDFDLAPKQSGALVAHWLCRRLSSEGSSVRLPLYSLETLQWASPSLTVACGASA